MYGLLVIDECHRLGGGWYSQSILTRIADVIVAVAFCAWCFIGYVPWVHIFLYAYLFSQYMMVTWFVADPVSARFVTATIWIGVWCVEHSEARMTGMLNRLQAHLHRSGVSKDRTSTVLEFCGLSLTTLEKRKQKIVRLKPTERECMSVALAWFLSHDSIYVSERQRLAIITAYDRLLKWNTLLYVVGTTIQYPAFLYPMMMCSPQFLDRIPWSHTRPFVSRHIPYLRSLGYFLIDNAKTIGLDLNIISTSCIDYLCKTPELREFAVYLLAILEGNKTYRLDLRSVLYGVLVGVHGSHDCDRLLQYAIRTSGPDGMENSAVWSPWWHEWNQHPMNRPRDYELEFFIPWYQKAAQHRSMIDALNPLLAELQDEQGKVFAYRDAFTKQFKFHASVYLTEPNIVQLSLNYYFDPAPVSPTPFWKCLVFR